MRRESSRFSAQDRRRQIMDVAMDLFSKRGFVGTTTREIAKAARVNEAIIFRHFPRKEDLYWAIVEGQCQEKSGKPEIPFADSTDDRRVFETIAEEILRKNSANFKLSRLLLYTALENHKLSHRFFRTYVAEYFHLLAHHIEQRIRKGAFRQVDPLLAARGFLGMVSYHLLIQELFGGKRYQRFDPRKVSRTLTDIWLQGMAK